MKKNLSVSAFLSSIVVFLFLMGGHAVAQPWSLFDFNFSSSTASGKQLVSFPKKYDPGQIIVSFGDRRLYHILKRGRAVSYPIAVPRPKSRWDGVETVSMKRINPTWTPTSEMREENPKLPKMVAGGDPLNPLGSRAIYLGNTLYRIHGTDAPWTIGTNVSRGCIRMHNKHVEELYNRVRIGMKVTSTWQKYRTATISRGTSTASNFNPFNYN
jgi:lipoprotein-anchoring transpeptidase ErfK/SrfK